MTNLVAQYIGIVTASGTLAEALRVMNSTLGTGYIHSRLREWERGDRVPSPPVVNYMLDIVVPVLLHREGISDENAAVIRDACRLPVK